MKLLKILLLLLFVSNYLIAANTSKNDFIDYEKYGIFKYIGTGNFQYIITNKAGLQKAMLPGVFPNFEAIAKDSGYIEANINGKLDGFLWDFVDKKKDPIINFYKWAANTEEQLGVRLFYVGYALEKAGRLKDAIKAYYAILIHAPKTISYTYWHTPLYIGRIVIDRIRVLLRRYPELGYELKDARITILNIFDNDMANVKFIYINPGKLVKVEGEKPKIDLKNYKIIETRGGNNVCVKKFSNGHWQLFKGDKPFIIKGMSYGPNKVGLSPDRGTLDPTKDWQLVDENKSGTNDVFFKSYVDKNNNSKRDEDEPRIGDAQLLKDMGVNTIRLYNHCFNKKLFRKLYKDYGLNVLMGDFLGVYAANSGASWEAGTDYSDPEQRENMKNSVKEMVEEYKNEPYVVMWVLGNENNYSVACNVKDKPEIFYAFVQEVVKMVHLLDPTRPVALCNGDLLYLDIIAKQCPDIDILGVNCYRGPMGFGDSFWDDIAETINKPVLITEYGCPAYANNLTSEEAEQGQYDYHKGNWEDMAYNQAGGFGKGNSLGGVIFEWCDEWWKAGSGTDPGIHATQPQFGGPFLDGWSYEEWYGICSQGNGLQIVLI